MGVGVGWGQGGGMEEGGEWKVKRRKGGME